LYGKYFLAAGPHLVYCTQDLQAGKNGFACIFPVYSLIFLFLNFFCVPAVLEMTNNDEYINMITRNSWSHGERKTNTTVQMDFNTNYNDREERHNEISCGVSQVNF